MIDDQTADEVVAAYRNGDKIRDIETRFNMSRATVYWVLEQKGVAPDRAKRGYRLRGDDHELAALYELIEAQDDRIRSLLRLLEINGIEIPSDFED